MAKVSRAVKAAEKQDPTKYESQTLSKKEQRQIKKLIKKHEQPTQENNEDDDDDNEEEEEEEEASDVEAIESRLNLEALADSESESEEDDDEDDDEVEDEEAEEEEEEEEEEDDVPLSDVEIDSDADIVPHTKLTVNNVSALKESLSRIAVPWNKYNFDEHQSLTYHTKVETDIKDIYDDTERELQFFKQGLDAAIEGRKRLLALKIPFSRPLDYFAEMVKTDEHMEKLKVKLMKEASEKKASEEAKRQRQLKKFGKKVQHETLQQRQKEKRDTLDKIKSLKKKRQSNEMGNDEFDIAVEEAAAARDEFGTGRKGGNKRQKIQKKVANSSSSSSGKKRPGKSSRRRNKR